MFIFISAFSLLLKKNSKTLSIQSFNLLTNIPLTVINKNPSQQPISPARQNSKGQSYKEIF